MSIQEMRDADREAVAQFIEQHWRSRLIMSQGRSFYPHEQEALIDSRNGQIVGLVTFRIDSEGMEVLTLNAKLEGYGIGSTLMLRAMELARKRNCRRVWLTTTNDNLRAIGFYQRLGFRMIAIHLGAVDEARKTKPQIPELGERGVPIHDEIVLEVKIEPYLDEPAK